MSPVDSHDARERFVGSVTAFGAYAIWGLLPLYWKAIHGIPSAQVLCHRVIWSAALLQVILWLWKGRSRRAMTIFASKQATGYLILSALFIGANWLLYIWAVTSGFVLETSLGYFINPLFNVVLGMVVFKERLRPLQILAVALATLGVANLAIRSEGFPWIAVILAGTFGIYGLIRKVVRVDSLSGLWFETAVLTLPALGYLWFDTSRLGTTILGHGAWTDALLIGSGLVTATPLLLFGIAAQRLPLTTLGFFQYVAPTIQFLLAVLVYREPFTAVHFVTFGLIWCALAIITTEGLYAANKARRLAGASNRDDAP